MSRSKYDKDYKASVIDKGLVERLVKNKKALYKGENIQVQHFNEDGELDFDLVCESWGMYSLAVKTRSKELECACLLIESKAKKIKKVKEKIKDIVMTSNAVFITLTFTDEVLARTSAQTRRRYVSRYLKAQGCRYVANIDFSPDLNREHYHAVIDKKVNLKEWSYGFSYAEQVRAHDRSLCRLSKYITKLTSHALKVDFTRLIYSRV